ncbi:mitochondrial antiviral-signaling protein [Austrofundulus limnaeus]|uniref:Mitochondrial antiviral-signaling protein n=1 Tax=Austrofundulus limnaeus TaxID=52670 RepID=A0A2I4C0J0_AUSLI|nr:PREDICTED: mitochondrial antiviral-signaling protein [Austrofundulus limnaeus]
MSFASDKLWDGYLRRNMSTIVSKVKVGEIMPHLPCLTTHDRENIQAKRETNGNYDAMMVLLECLRRRDNWAEQFIEGLDACENPKLSAEMRKEYNALRGVNNPGPVRAPSNVVRAHVHQAPDASQLPAPESEENSQAAVAPPEETPPATQERAALAPPFQTSESSPEPVPEPPVSTEKEAPLPSTPPPSPEIPHAHAAKAPQLQEILHFHQEPEENSESSIQVIPGDTSLIPDEVNSGNEEAAVSVSTPPKQRRPVSTKGGDTSPSADYFHTAVSTKLPHSPAAPQMSLDGSSVPTRTPEKPPVQDTTPPVNKVPAAALLPEEPPEPAATQIVRSSPRTGRAATASRPGGMSAPRADDDYETVCLSKPNQLISFQPENSAGPPVQASNSHVAPYSGNSGRLEISESLSDTLIPTSLCQENGTTPNSNEPEENHYESPNQTMEEVLENVVHVSETPSIPNLDGQTMVPQTNSERSVKSTSETPVFTNAANSNLSSLNHPHPHSESNNPSEPKSLQSSEEKIAPCNNPCQSSNAKYFLVAAGVGICALLMVWKFKK